MPVPDSARDAAIEIARKLNLKYREALVKNRYIGRTFIMPGDEKRKSSVRQKLNPIASEIQGKNVLLVDDSIVRGNTSRAIVQMLREAGAKKVYFASYSPPLRHPCVYGIDMQTKTEFVAQDADEAAVARKIGADKVIYQSLAALKKAVQQENPKIKNFCAACFDGIYPTGDITPDLLDGHRGRPQARPGRPARAQPLTRPAAAQSERVRTFRHQLLFAAYQRTVRLSPSANGTSGSQPRARMRLESMA